MMNPFIYMFLHPRRCDVHKSQYKNHCSDHTFTHALTFEHLQVINGNFDNDLFFLGKIGEFFVNKPILNKKYTNFFELAADLMNNNVTIEEMIIALGKGGFEFEFLLKFLDTNAFIKDLIDMV